MYSGIWGNKDFSYLFWFVIIIIILVLINGFFFDRWLRRQCRWFWYREIKFRVSASLMFFVVFFVVFMFMFGSGFIVTVLVFSMFVFLLQSSSFTIVLKIWNNWQYNKFIHHWLYINDIIVKQKRDTYIDGSYFYIRSTRTDGSALSFSEFDRSRTIPFWNHQWSYNSI